VEKVSESDIDDYDQNSDTEEEPTKYQIEVIEKLFRCSRHCSQNWCNKSGFSRTLSPNILYVKCSG
jgi:hypothetical protein